MTHDTFGQKYLKPFAIFDPDTQSLKMFEDTLVSDLTEFSATLPVSGSMQNGVLCEPLKPEPHTKDPDFTLLRTLVASEVSGGIVDYDKAKEKGNMISLTAQIKKFLPTPVARDYKGDSGRKDNVSAVVRQDFAQFEPAIQRWEAVTGRTAPEPLLPDTKLNPAFTEWMMGLPEGWITDVDISWTQQIKACGNGVVPQQALLALSRLT